MPFFMEFFLLISNLVDLAFLILNLTLTCACSIKYLDPINFWFLFPCFKLRESLCVHESQLGFNSNPLYVDFTTYCTF